MTTGELLSSLYQVRFSHEFFTNVRQKLLTNQHHEQSGFIPKKSTVDRILAPLVITERLRDFRTRLLAAYVDIRRSFGSVNQDVL